MPDNQSTPPPATPPSQPLDNVLSELEKKFSLPLENNEEQFSQSSGDINLMRVNKKKVLTGLTLLFVVSGSVAGFYLTQTAQEVRQNAKEPDSFEVVPTPQVENYPDLTTTSVIQIINNATGLPQAELTMDGSVAVSFTKPQVKSTILTFTGPTSQTMTLNTQPFTIDQASLKLSPGSYTVEAIGYAQSNGLGIPLEQQTFQFIVATQ